MDLKETPSQTVGPFFGFALPYDAETGLAPALVDRALDAWRNRA